MSETRSTVLACVDGSSHQQAVVDYASWVARTINAPLKLLHNLEHREPPVTADLSGSLGIGGREGLLEELTTLEARRSKLLMEQGKQMLAEAKQRALDNGVTEVISLQRHGSVAETLMDMEDEIKILVLGIRGESHDKQSTRLGGQLETIIRSVHRPILVVNHSFDKPPKRFMLAYDGSVAARKALDMVVESTVYQGREPHLVHVGNNEGIVSEAEQALKKAGYDVVTARLDGNVEQQLTDYQHQHDIELTVMGAFGHSRLRELLMGSITNRLLLQAKMPVLLLR